MKAISKKLLRLCACRTLPINSLMNVQRWLFTINSNKNNRNYENLKSDFKQPQQKQDLVTFLKIVAELERPKHFTTLSFVTRYGLLLHCFQI